jgi:hypothetical protein
MRRILLLAVVALVMVAMMVAAPALAAEGGNPTAGSCGIGQEFSSDLREDDFNYKKEKISPKPGGGEASELHPTNCPGSD